MHINNITTKYDSDNKINCSYSESELREISNRIIKLKIEISALIVTIANLAIKINNSKSTTKLDIESYVDRVHSVVQNNKIKEPNNNIACQIEIQRLLQEKYDLIVIKDTMSSKYKELILAHGLNDDRTLDERTQIEQQQRQKTKKIIIITIAGLSVIPAIFVMLIVIDGR
jgi:hypothetical protein